MSNGLSMLTIAEICDLLKVHERTVYRWLKSGKLRGVKAGKLWRIPRANLEAFLAGETAPEPATAMPQVQPGTQAVPNEHFAFAPADPAPPAPAAPPPPAPPVDEDQGKAMRRVKIRFAGEEGQIVFDEENPADFRVEIAGPIRERIIEHFTTQREFKLPESQGRNDYRIDRARPVDNANYFTLALCTLHVNTGVRVEW